MGETGYNKFADFCCIFCFYLLKRAIKCYSQNNQDDIAETLVIKINMTITFSRVNLNYLKQIYLN